MEKAFAKDYQALIDSFEPLLKSEDNPFFKSKYVKLADILPVVKKNCKANNFLLFQAPDVVEGKSVLMTKFVHIPTDTDITGRVELVHKPEDPQKLGGSMTYMRRYSLSCMLGLEEIDDDGNYASGNATGNVSGIPSPPMEKQVELAKKGQLICEDCASEIPYAEYVRGAKAGQVKLVCPQDWKHKNFISKVEKDKALDKPF